MVDLLLLPVDPVVVVVGNSSSSNKSFGTAAQIHFPSLFFKAVNLKCDASLPFHWLINDEPSRT